MADGAVFDPTTARWLITIARQIEKSQVLNPGYLERVVLKVMPRFQGGGSSVKYFVLAEDAAVLPVHAWRGDLDPVSGGITAKPGETEPFELYYSNDALRSPNQAQAGYTGHYETDET
jgi:hypothetical protein